MGMCGRACPSPALAEGMPALAEGGALEDRPGDAGAARAGGTARALVLEGAGARGAVGEVRPGDAGAGREGGEDMRSDVETGARVCAAAVEAGHETGRPGEDIGDGAGRDGGPENEPGPPEGD